MSTIFLTGASGYIGGSVAQRLLADGHRVRALVRSDVAAGRLAEMGIDPVLGSLDDLELLTREARQSDGVINAASSDHAGAVHALLDGLKGTAKALIHTSGSSVVGDDARGNFPSELVFDEQTPFVVSALKRPRREIDIAVLSAGSVGVRSIVVCPSLIYGIGKGLNPDSVQVPFLTRHARAHGAVQLVGAGLNVWSNVHIADLVDLYALALSRAPAGSLYFAENGEASFVQMGAAIARRLGLSGIQFVDAEVAAQEWGEAKAYYTLGSNSRVRAVRARNELGWSPKHTSVLNWILEEMP